MIVSNKKTSFFYGIVLLFLGLAIEVGTLHTMERESEFETEEERAVLYQLAKLEITKGKSYTLVAQDWIKQLDELKGFLKLDQKQKQIVLENFLIRAEELAYSREQGCFHPVYQEINRLEDLFIRPEYSYEDNFHLYRLDLIINLGQQLLKKLIDSLDEDKKDAQDIQSTIDNQTKFHTRIKAAEAMLDYCHCKYRALNRYEEKSYIEVLQNIYERANLGVFFEKVLLIELLNHCDTEFKNKNEACKSSLSIFDLREDVRKLYGYEPTASNYKKSRDNHMDIWGRFTKTSAGSTSSEDSEDSNDLTEETSSNDLTEETSSDDLTEEASSEQDDEIRHRESINRECTIFLIAILISVITALTGNCHYY